jgi:hypothetical protein
MTVEERRARGRGMSSLGEKANLALPRKLILRLQAISQQMSEAAGREVTVVEVVERMADRQEAGT